MRKRIITMLLGFAIAAIQVNAQNDEIHSASVLGNSSFGKFNVSTLLDLETGCVLRSNPHDVGQLNPGDQVELNFKFSDNSKAEVIKQGLTKRLFAFNNECIPRNSVVPDNPNNPYDYSGVYVKDMLIHINNNWSTLKDSKPTYDGYIDDYLQSQGYSHSDLQSYRTITEASISSFSSMSTYLEHEMNTGVMSRVEKQLLDSYLSHLELKSNVEIISYSLQFENQIVANQSLSDNSKKTILTTTSIVKHISSVEQWGQEGLPNGGVQPLLVDLEIACGGNVVVGMLSGAALGNGPGAAVGILTGMWASYTMGCFD